MLRNDDRLVKTLPITMNEFFIYHVVVMDAFFHRVTLGTIREQVFSSSLLKVKLYCTDLILFTI